MQVITYQHAIKHKVSTHSIIIYINSMHISPQFREVMFSDAYTTVKLRLFNSDVKNCVCYINMKPE